MDAEKSRSITELAIYSLQEEEYEKILFILSSLLEKSGARFVALINRSGQEIAHCGEWDNLDRQALSSLAASNLAATFGLARLTGEKEFERIFHKGDQTSILINPVGDNALLLFILTSDQQERIDLRTLKQAKLILKDVLAKSQKGK